MKSFFTLLFALLMSIGMMAQSITITSPNGGETWPGCTNHSITWTQSGTSGYFNVEYSTNNGSTWAVLASNYSGTSLNWTVPNISTSEALVRVYDFNNNTVSDLSNLNFTITPALVVSTPNGGESWQVGGSAQNIVWNGYGTSNSFLLEYSVNAGGSWASIVNTTFSPSGNTYTYAWTIPNNPSTACLVRVTDNGSSCKTDASDNLFTIAPATPVLTVNSPNGGNTLYIGQSHTITWSSAYLSSSFVKIEYSVNNGSAWTTIISSTNNTGSYNWSNIPNTPSPNCLVRISDVGNPSTNDISNAVFTIALGAITVNAPNGGESLNGCNTYSITWTRTGTSNYFNIDYSINNGVSWSALASNYYQSGGNCTFSWTVPNVSTSQARVRIYDYNNSAIRDSSNAAFTIVPALVITSPNGGETWQGGTSKTITWTQGPGASNDWTIRYSTDAGNNWTTVVSGVTVANGQYTWNPLPNTPSANCLIQMYDYQNSSCRTDISDNLFTISPATPVITVSSPNGGNTFYIGSAYTVSWTSSYLTSPFVKLEYSTDNGATWQVIANSTNNDGSETWSVPNTPSLQCLIRVSEFGNPAVYDVSNAVFSIVYPYVTITSPNGGESWAGCSSQTITWAGYGAGSGPWKVEYSNNNGSSWNILTSGTSSSSYTWNPVPNIPGTQYLVRVTKTTDALVTDVSNATFNITLNTAIVVNTPNGGESWQVGGTAQLITWAWSGTSNYYNLYYSINNGSTWITIATYQYITNGQYSWTIPNNPSTQCLVRVEDDNNPCKYDVSDTVFTIAAPTPTITVTSPNGGNNLYVGGTNNITWNSAYLSSNFVTIEYSVDNGASWTTLFASTGNDGSEPWTIPNTPSVNCLVRISEYGNPSVYDVSNAVFNIKYPFVSITSPNGGESWNGCSSQSITWSAYGASGPWKVEYTADNGTTWNTLTSSTSSSSYTWNPVPNTPSTQCSVRVTKTTDALVTDMSNSSFTITQNTAIVVTSPNGGENWQVANPNTRTITWTSSGTSYYYNLYYSIDNGSTWTAITTYFYSSSSTPQYTWTIPNTPSAQVLIRVEDYNNVCKFDVSDAVFTIQAPTPVITVTAPNGGNTYYVGTSYNITWSSAYLTSPYVKIEYSINNGGAWTTIINSTNNDGSESWTIPNTPSAQCLVRVSEFNNAVVYDISNAVFSIVYPYVVITAPNGGESWAGCSTQTITWSGYGTGNGSWKVEYSTDNGALWNILTNSTSSSSYSWNPVPNNPGTQYLIRVTKTTDALVTDISNTTFTITLNTAIVINTPNGGENWQVGGATQLITWAWSGTSNYYNLYYSINNGATWITIATYQYITNGQYSWTLPNNPSTQCLIRVEDDNNPCKYDVSDAVFTISSPTPYITVNSPNGGNNLYVGGTNSITWSSGYLNSNFVTIEYSVNNGASWTTIFASTSNDGSESWTIPNTPSVNCLVRISEYGNASVYDVSNAVFNIKYPYVAVTSPNGGESWNGCSSQSITWSAYGASGPWKVEYTADNGTTWNTLTSSTSSSSYTWNPVPNTPSTQCSVRVTKTADALVTDVSNANFTITQNTAIIVTSPNGGENWQVANPNTRTITWTASGTSYYYNLYYSTNNGSTWTTITTNYYSGSSSPQYTWTIPNAPSAQVIVKVEDYNNSCKFDVSDAVFTILAPTPVITVTAPNGGNTFYVGTSYNISWSSQYLTSSFVKLEYTNDNGATWNVILTATNNDGSESWSVPNTPSSQCLVRVSEYGNPSVNDISNAVFSIVAPYITVTSPNGGESWNGCVSQSITWSGYGTGSGPYRVEYSTNNGYTWTTLVTSTTSSSFSWNPVTNISTTQALVRVSLVSNTAVNDVSNANFTLNQQTYIIINTPNGGENWQVDNPATRTISWASASVSNYYNIYYSVNGGASWNTIISNQYITSNQYVWTIPNNPSNNVFIKIEDYNNTCKYDITDAPMTITAPTPYITVTSPNGGQTLYAYNTASITWSSDYLSSAYVKIEYSADSSATWVEITGSTSNNGSYSWTVPSISTTKALIRVTDVGNNATSDVSNATFTIKPAVVVTAPDGGENLSGCTVTTITWQGEGSSGSYQLQYSLNGGNTWNTIVSQSFSGGPNYSYNWTLPNTPSDYCLVKVKNNGNSSKVDQSDEVFSITSTIAVTNPGNGGSFAVGSSLNITWTAQGVSNYYNIDYSTNGGSTWNSIVFNSYITTNSYNWNVPNAPSTNCYIRVTDNNNTCKQDINDLAFTIAAAPAAITVTSPNGGESWTICSSHDITWSANGTSGAYDIEYSSNNGSTWSTVISNYTSTNGIYNWTVPSATTLQGLIRVKDHANGTVADQSNAAFSLAALATPGTITGNSAVCEGSSQTYSIALVPGATSYTWTLPAGWTGSSTSNTINAVSGNTGGNISVVANNSCSSSTASGKTITVTALPATPGAISGPTAPCSGIFQTYSITAVSGATAYSWVLPSGYSGASTTNSINVMIGNSAGPIQVFALNSCGSGSSSSLTITPSGISLPLQPGNITGTTAPCANTVQTYSITSVAGASSYTWTLPSGWTGSSTTNTIVTTVGSAGGTISVIANNSCGSSTAQNLSVSVSSVPAQPGSITGSTSVCANSSNIYSISPVAGALNYTWTPPAGWTGQSSSTSINSVAAGSSGSIQVTANNTCGTSMPRTLAITVNNPVTPGVSVVHSPTGSICGNTSVTFTATPLNGGTPSYQWIKNNVAVGVNSPNYNASGWNDHDSVWVILTSNISCVTSPLATSNKTLLDVTPVVSPEINISTANTSICSGQSVTFGSSTTGGGTNPVYQWKKNGANISGATTDSYTTNAIVNNDVFTCTMISDAPCVSPALVTSNSLTMTVSNNAVSDITITATPAGAVCAGTLITFSSNITNGGSAPVYDWRVNGISVGSASNYASSSLNNNDSVMCYMTSGLTCVTPATAASNSIAVTVNPYAAPVVTIVADNNPAAPGQTVTFSATPVNGGTSPSYQWRVNGTLINGATASTYATSAITDGAVYDVVMTSDYPCLLKDKDTSNVIEMHIVTSYGHTLSGKTVYAGKANAGNPAPTPPTYASIKYSIDNVIVILKSFPGGVELARDTSNDYGVYQFSNVMDGNYLLTYDKYTPDTMLLGNDLNAIDVAMVKYYIGADTITDPSRNFSKIYKRAANVDNNSTINAVDIARIKGKVGSPLNVTKNFPAGNWPLTDTMITMAGADMNLQLKTICYGDFNASSSKYRDSLTSWASAKSLPKNIIITSDEYITTEDPGYFEIPLRISTKMNDLSALGLELIYPNEDYKLINVTMPKTVHKNGMTEINPTLDEIIADDNDLLVTDENGVIRVVFATTNHFDVADNEEVIRLGFRPVRTLPEGEIGFYLNGTGVIGDQYGEENDETYLLMPKILVLGNNAETGFEFSGYPNPFYNNTTLTYSIPESGSVKLKVFNTLGEMVTVLVDEHQNSGRHTVAFSPEELPAGLYTFKLEFTGTNNAKCRVLKLVH
ncbi:MAG TPA: hypothetical protein PKW80_09565 [Bacteroidales bacterium]|nr:hypothetical protein [Bacteroidales bacterium]